MVCIWRAAPEHLLSLIATFVMNDSAQRAPIPSSTSPQTPAASINRATVRVLTALSEFAVCRQPMGVTELADRLSMSKNMAFRALNTLLSQGYLVRATDGKKYQLGYQILELAHPDAAEADLRSLAWPTMERIQKLTHETVVLSVRSNDWLVVLDGIESNASVRTRAPIGSIFPLHASPASRAMLAALPDADINQYIRRRSPLKKLTDQTVTEPDELWKEIQTVRKQGYALGYGDATPGRQTIAFALLDRDQMPWGAINIGGPSNRFTRSKMNEFLPTLQSLIEELNQRTALFSAPAVNTWID